MTKKKVIAADLFCGAGGSSTGLSQACEKAGRQLDLTAINHWETAVETHTANHPEARHLCEQLDSVDPRKLFKRLDILVASPECTHHSNARGDRPVQDQSRATGWHVIRWAEALRPTCVLVENVKEFASWGPIGSNGRPLKSRRGETFTAFLNALRSLGYRAEYRILQSADFGDPTTRERLFVLARRGRKPIDWPEPTHTKTGERLLSGQTKLWRTAREIIDWNIPGKSIFGRKRPLKDTTLERIAAGLKKYGGAAAEPFLVMLRGTAPNQVPTVTSVDACGLVSPFLVKYNRTGGPRPLDEPLATLTTNDRYGLVQQHGMDILFRMLLPHELAAAMSFPPNYYFAGTRDEKVKQIGNACSVKELEALGSTMISWV